MVKLYCKVMKRCNLMNDNTLASSVKKARKKLNALSLKKVTFSIKFFF